MGEVGQKGDYMCVSYQLCSFSTKIPRIRTSLSCCWKATLMLEVSSDAR